ncbi:hypothetical protein ANCCAN_24728 [Ancylostoma caninum]|uniref:Uncharacterized protein n=1 Tax=Ancylostoma caninum TaxID=29170 RepID=A0A368FD24_ANCCA|nr:hypothetical protein ANCCAN_24728 [Ancylostoma caninum]
MLFSRYRIIWHVLCGSSCMGLSVCCALFADFFSLLTLHIVCFDVYASRLLWMRRMRRRVYSQPLSPLSTAPLRQQRPMSSMLWSQSLSPGTDFVYRLRKKAGNCYMVSQGWLDPVSCSR